MTGTAKAFTLDRYGIVQGVTISGRVRVSGLEAPLAFTGSVHVAGAAADRGTLTLAGRSLRGRLQASGAR
jgi:hypothetical protein